MLTIEPLNDPINYTLAWVPINLSIWNLLIVNLVEEEQTIIISGFIRLCLLTSSYIRLLFGISTSSIILKSGGNRIISPIVVVVGPRTRLVSKLHQ